MNGIRTRQYPPLQCQRGPRLSIVLPTKGDLRLRPLLPDAFRSQLVIHCTTTHRHLYQKFLVVRKFVVMSSDGNLFTQMIRTELHLNDLPNQTLLLLPTSMQSGDIIKVLDLIQCYTFSKENQIVPNIRWELVRVRWRNEVETWLPIELMVSQSPLLLQEFYVNSLNSWGFQDRLLPQSLDLYQTEGELWLHQAEFQSFYKQLRKRRALLEQTSQTGPLVNNNESTVTPIQRIEPSPSVGENRNTSSEVEERNTSCNSRDVASESNTVLDERITQSQVPAALVEKEQIDRPINRDKPRNDSITTKSDSNNKQRKRLRQSQVTSDDEEHLVNRRSTREKHPNGTITRKKSDSTQQKRLRQSQITSDDDDLPNTRERAAKGTPNSNSTRRKRLRQSQVICDEEESLVASVKEEKQKENSKANHEDAVDTRRCTRSHKRVELIEIDDEEDVEAMYEQVNEPRVDKSDTRVDATTTEKEPEGYMGQSIRCVCGIVHVGRYAGRWLQCWNEDCNAWEHAECVGYILPSVGDTTIPLDHHKCAQCDSTAYRERYRQTIATRAIEWMERCCESRNERQLLKILTDSTAVKQIQEVKWLVNRDGATLLMLSARFGLLRVVKQLIRHHNVPVIGVDRAHGRNVLYYAAMGESLKVTRFLFLRYPRLVNQHDMTEGQTPLDLILQSRKLNGLLCLPSPSPCRVLENDSTLILIRDRHGRMLIHKACSVVTAATVEIVEQILRVQPLAMWEKCVADGKTPLMLLGQASGITTEEDEEIQMKAKWVQAIIQHVQDIDMFGQCLEKDRDARGWTVFHFVAAAGNYELLQYLLKVPIVDRHCITYESGETALHLAARLSYSLTPSIQRASAQCVRILLANGLDVMAVDSIGWIPILRATSACLDEFLHYHIRDQLIKLSKMARNYRQRDAVRRWITQVSTTDTSFSILNDWFASSWSTDFGKDGEGVYDECENLILLTKSLLRVDNKLMYLYHVVLETIRKTNPTSDDERLTVLFSCPGSTGCYWQEFVHRVEAFEPEHFRYPLRFIMVRNATSRVEHMTLVLLRLVSGLVQADTGILDRRTSMQEMGAVEPSSRFHSAQDSAILTQFYILGELVAYLVLQNVVITEIFEFTTDFLRCVVKDDQPVTPLTTVRGNGTRPNFPRNLSEGYIACAESFASGFTHVIPIALSLLHVNELRLLFNGNLSGLDITNVDWTNVIRWKGFEPLETDQVLMDWWDRLLLEIIPIERMLLVLWLSQTFREATRMLFSECEDHFEFQRYELNRSDVVEEEEQDVDYNTLLPVMERSTKTLFLPQYSTYDIFKAMILRVIRAS